MQTPLILLEDPMRRLGSTLLLAAGVLALGCNDRETPTAPAPGAPANDKPTLRVTVDGVIGKNEWRNAVSLAFKANAPEGLVPAELLAQRDETTLYLAIVIHRPAGGLDGSAGFEFDNDNDGVPLEDLDDQIITGGVPPSSGLADFFRGTFNGSSGSEADALAGGTNDGDAAVNSDATTTTYEFSHPLNSGDPHDIALSKTMRQVGLEADIRIALPGAADPETFGQNTLTQLAAFGKYCKLTAFPAMAIGPCAEGQVASVRVTRNANTSQVGLISMGTFQTFVEPLGLFTYDYLGNAVAATCDWESSDPGIVQVDQSGHISTASATGSAVISASCSTGGWALLTQGAVRVDVS
jgi:hypothetical protein